MFQASKWMMAPLWLLGLFGQAKSFRDNPLIGSVLLNRCGLHVARVLAARVVAHLRWTLLRGKIDPLHRRTFQRDGILCIDDFVSGDDLKSLKSEVVAHSGPVRQTIQRGTATQRILLDDAALFNHPRLTQLTRDKKLLDLLSYCGAKASRPLFSIHQVRNGVAKGSDPQKVLHADTFHPTMKAWLFLEDVGEDQGPFNYVRSSHLLTWARLKWEYRRSKAVRFHPDGYSEKGSFRVNDEDLVVMGLKKPEAIVVKAGTLVIANTNGFHRRGQATPGASRLALWAYSRHNPFNPLPGLSSQLIQNLEYKVLQRYWSGKDKRAASLGKRPAWHLIDAEGMFPTVSRSGQELPLPTDVPIARERR